MPRRKQDRPKRMKWEDGGESCKDEDMPGSEKGHDPVEDEDDEGEDQSEDPPAPQGDHPDEAQSETEEEDHTSPEMTLPAAVKMEPEIGETDAEPADTLTTRKDGTPSPKVERSSPVTATPPPPVLSSVESPLDFSMKKGLDCVTETLDSVVKEEVSDDDMNLEAEDGPLDLSVPRRRKAGSSLPRKHKAVKLDPALPKPSSPWGYNVPKALPPNPGKHDSGLASWNGKVKSHHHHHHGHQTDRISHGGSNKGFSNSKLGSPTSQVASSSPAPEVSTPSRSSGAGSRQNPWQTQWMSKSGEQAKDVFTCVWCKESFRSLAEMTVHMKQSPRCGMAGMQASSVPPAAVSPQPSPSAKISGGSGSGGGCSSVGGSSGSVMVKESMPLPRKLVRGQDVWLGKGAEQTRQILKCMWCGQSFKTLADMTTHMRVTQHYTNIISQEQIISWRTPEDKMATQSQVNAVLTCKVCDQAFGSLKELSYHMVKNSHYKEHILRSISEGGGRRRQTRERRKKSLPVRKLLELERMEMGKQGQSNHESEGHRGGGEPAADGKITCEECAEKVDAKDFVQHIKNCSAQRNNHQRIKSELCDESGDEAAGPATPGPDRVSSPDTKPSPSETAPQQATAGASAGPATERATPTPDNAEKAAENSKTPGETSVLNAIERLIEKSFEYKGRRGAPTTGILQRLGIDEEVYPPWHPANSPGGKHSLLGKGSDRAKSTSPLRFEPGDFARHEELSRKRLFDAYNHVSASSETSRGSTPISLMNTSSPTRSLTESPHRTHSSMTGSTAGSPPPSPHSLLQSPKPVSEYGSVRGLEDDCRVSEAARSPKNGRPDTDGSLCGSPKPAATFERPSRCSSVSSFDGRRTPLSDADPVRPPTPEPIELKATVSAPVVAPTKRKRPKSRHERSKGSKRNIKSEAEEKRSVSVDSILSSVSSEGAKASDLNADHPLKELQKLLDKTDAHLSRPALPSGPGSILAFSWACNDVTTSDSLMKCAFCETHFISKGAYRHHLSKMHFVKDPLGSPSDSPTWKGSDKAKNGSPEVGPGASAAASSSASSAPKETSSSSSHPPPEESPHSKFLKYTELAKQLSSKYV